VTEAREASAPTPPPDRTGYYARFLRAGGTFSLADWRGIMGQEDRDALEAAGELVMAERAHAIAQAIVAILNAPPPQDAPVVSPEAERSAMTAACLRAIGVAE